MRPAGLLFAFTIGLGAFLLFSVQPLVGKLLLPLFGGTSAVWITCMLFFQVVLLAGYLEAYLVAKVRSLLAQAVIQALLLLAAYLTAAFHFDPAAADLDRPIQSLLTLLLFSVGLPLTVLSASSPLLQSWFARTNEPNPYRLYAASNLGSLAAVALFPLVFEPALSLSTMARCWSGAFGFYAAASFICGIFASKCSPAARSEAPVESAAHVSRSQRIDWIILAAVPSSLLLGVTNYSTSNIAPIPLLWMVPLLLYLSSFVIAFSEMAPRVPLLTKIASLLTIPVLLTIIIRFEEPLWLLIPTHLLAFAAVATLYHTLLARARPPKERLTEYYLLLACGGALGGLFNAAAAPLLFSSLLEYPLLLTGSVLYLALRRRKELASKDLVYVAFLLMLSAVLVTYTDNVTFLIIGFSVPILLAYREGGYVYPVTLVGVLLTSVFTMRDAREIRSVRNFFGPLSVLDDGTTRQLVHGSTVHGMELINSQSCMPLSYYHPDGPAGSIFKQAMLNRPSLSVAVIGLGAGSLACYARPEDAYLFIEINPLVIRLAEENFTLLKRSAGKLRTVMGDGRLALQVEPESSFDIIAVDAFSSDAIPVHLLTQEAFALYRRKLKPGGTLLVHISNKFLDLRGVVEAGARSAGMSTFTLEDLAVSDEANKAGHWASTWAAAVRQTDARFASPLEARPWTDDYSSLVRALR